MEALAIRKQALNQALKTLYRSLQIIKDPEYEELQEELRDFTIKRFEYSIDTFWKYVREYIEAVHKVSIGPVISLKAVFRSALNLRVISQDEFEVLLLMIDGRNLTSHTYNQELAETIGQRLEGYYMLLSTIFKRTL